ncbi:AraC family transcriptional regulator [Spirosoma sp. KCTC 42546]|uniref:AraC family transcriptional regulator n=1 Tax=Spirosoma sp. KCTC 42546 TaxID=2520506 RepID=UPI00115C2BA0|nr:AraC family transcriptional regulator [Spirosoma sp. KCTC 42546]QDK77565.1 AraC family transcriptional regulator [Spirosoma sp. KCTC 42546]
MVPKLHIVPKPLDNAFSIRHDRVPQFGSIWHYHPEIELHYLIKGEGIRFVGDSIGNFQQDDMILMGSNVPHTWKCNNPCSSNYHVEALVLHFHPDCLGKEFLNVYETQGISKLFEQAKNGLLIKGNSKEKIKRLMWRMIRESGLNKVVYLLRIYVILLESSEYEMLSNSVQYTKFNQHDGNRMEKVLSFTLQNFRNKILIDDVAKLTNLSVTSFCRYFKMMSNKSYFDFLTEVRLSHACRLLIKTDFTIANIALDSGFENPSNFYRHFKNVKGITPKEYKSRFFTG